MDPIDYYNKYAANVFEESVGLDTGEPIREFLSFLDEGDTMEFDGAFDGVWAYNSLIHIPKPELPGIFKRVAKALEEDGIFFLSMRLGDSDGFRGERYFNAFSERELRSLLEQDGYFKVEKEWVSNDIRANHPNTKWIHILARKPGGQA